MKKTLSSLASQGLIEELQIHDIASESLPANLQFIRSVPITLINNLPFIGTYNEEEIQFWISKDPGDEFVREYISDNLNKGQLTFIASIIRQQPALLHHVIPLLNNADTSMQVRIGITALFEEFENQSFLLPLIPALKELAQHPQINIATDAIYCLSHIKAPELKTFFQSILDHKHGEIRELAEEALSRFVN